MKSCIHAEARIKSALQAIAESSQSRQAAAETPGAGAGAAWAGTGCRMWSGFAQAEVGCALKGRRVWVV